MSTDRERDTLPPSEELAADGEFPSTVNRDLIRIAISKIELLSRGLSEHIERAERQERLREERDAQILDALSGLGSLVRTVEHLSDEVSRLRADSESAHRAARTTASKLEEHGIRIAECEARGLRHSDRLTQHGTRLRAIESRETSIVRVETRPRMVAYSALIMSTLTTVLTVLQWVYR
jgi:hypothetical protein